MDYEPLLRRDVLDPLELRDTTVTLSPEQTARFVPGYDGDFNPQVHWTGEFIAPAGLIVSSARDMGRYLQHQLGLQSGPLAQAIALSHQRQNNVSGGTDIALAWMITQQGAEYMHTGRTGGYDSYAGFDVNHHVGVVVLCNTVTGFDEGLQRVGDHLLAVLEGRPAAPVPAPPLVTLPADTLDRYVGRYGDATDGEADVTRQDDTLYLNLDPDTRLWPESATRFHVRALGIAISVDFTLDDAGAPTQLWIHSTDGSVSLRLPRIP